MKLVEALKIVAKAPSGAKPMPVLLACGFTPLHLQNYLAAHLQQANPARKVVIETGLFGDLPGTIQNFVAQAAGTAVMALEWFDLDPRLGYRQTGGWGQRVVPGILENVNARLHQLDSMITGLSSSVRLIVSLPTLDLPPAFHTVGWQASEAEVALSQALTAFASRIVAHPSVTLLNQQRLNAVSPNSSRYDFRSDLNTGFPYTQTHAEALGSALAGLITAPPPKKGLITDLDDTLWSGLVGEIGAAEVSWDLSSHTQFHGLYQQSLRALAEQGVLVGIASKNSPAVVEQALNRSDLVVDRTKIFPVEVHWDAKSGSVERILKAWNISADSVVFIDDSPMELAEVKAAHPGIQCLLFPKEDFVGGLKLLHQLRDLFGKPRLSEEDSFRLESIRQGMTFAAAGKTGSVANDLLASAEAVLTLEFMADSADKRVWELVNKTNQFNLNGKRFTEQEWHEEMTVPDSFLVSVSYEDKFGPLGKIAAVKGHKQAGSVLIDTWVMSCRAFSRQIEHQVIAQIFKHFNASELVFQYLETAKNQPLTEFLRSLLKAEPKDGAKVTHNNFSQWCPQLHHEVRLKQ